jgi:hypothetical protein
MVCGLANANRPGIPPELQNPYNSGNRRRGAR